MLHPRQLAIAGGLLWGVCMALTTLLCLYTGYAFPFLAMMSSVYPGYEISWSGLLTGFVYGFFDVAIGLYLLAWLYNRLLTKQ